MKPLNHQQSRALAFAASLPLCAFTWMGVAYAADVRPVVKAAHVTYHEARHAVRRSGLI